MSVLSQLGVLGLLVGCAVAGGLLADRLRMPPLVGMLVAGIALRNLGADLLQTLGDRWSIALRLTALAVILLRAGLGLDLGALRRLRGAFLRLSFLPNLAEAATVAAAANWLLDLPWEWAVLLGFVVAAVSPAVVVPGLLDLQNRNYGVAKGIPTMVLAAASFDDVLSITGFGLAVSLIFGDGPESTTGTVLLRAPLELGFGLGLGIAVGLACGLLRRRSAGLRFAALAAGGLLAVGGGWLIGFTGGGSLAAVTLGAVAGSRWEGTDGGDVAAAPAGLPLDFGKAAVAALLGRVWVVAQPVLFGLIGAAVVLSAVDGASVLAGAGVLVLSVTVRVLVSYWSVTGAGLEMRERLFVALAWVPKATVQAAVGGLALDLAREQGMGQQAEGYGTQVLTVAVLAILITAPIGAVAIARAGPRWLDNRTGAPG